MAMLKRKQTPPLAREREEKGQKCDWCLGPPGDGALVRGTPGKVLKGAGKGSDDPARVTQAQQLPRALLS